jgi:hypothetical protein
MMLRPTRQMMSQNTPKRGVTHGLAKLKVILAIKSPELRDASSAIDAELGPTKNVAMATQALIHLLASRQIQAKKRTQS